MSCHIRLRSRVSASRATTLESGAWSVNTWKVHKQRMWLAHLSAFLFLICFVVFSCPYKNAIFPCLREKARMDCVAKTKQQPHLAHCGATNAAHPNKAARQECNSRENTGERDAEMARSRRRHRGRESDLNMNRMRHGCAELRYKIDKIEAAVREISTDPHVNLPINVDRKRQLPKMKLQLQRCVRGAFVRSYFDDRDTARR